MIFNSPQDYIIPTIGYTQADLDAVVEAAIKAERDRFAEEARPTINRAERRGYELAKEKAAKVCEEQKQEWNASVYRNGAIAAIGGCAAAIRSMK